MRKARAQAEGYAKALDEWPPFLVIVDVGAVIELWADFGRQGKSYEQFPDRRSHRIRLADLRDAAVRARDSLSGFFSDMRPRRFRRRGSFRSELYGLDRIGCDSMRPNRSTSARSSGRARMRRIVAVRSARPGSSGTSR